jgi:DUF1365 family protein
MPACNRWVTPSAIRSIFFGLDLEELPMLPAISRWFGHNQRRLLAVHDGDYLDHRPGDIGHKLRRFLLQAGVTDPIARVFPVTAARCLNY